MGVQKPYVGRAKVDITDDGLKLTIATQRNLFLIVFLLSGLIVWVSVYYLIFDEIILEAPFEEISLIIVGWLIGWTMVGIWAAWVLMCVLVGREVIIVSNETLRIIDGPPLMGKSKEYSLKQAQRFRVGPQWEQMSQFSGPVCQFRGHIGGKIAFDYGMRTVRFGAGVDEAEAHHIVEMLLGAGYLSKEQIMNPCE